jgi:hypothetical protein
MPTVQGVLQKSGHFKILWEKCTEVIYEYLVARLSDTGNNHTYMYAQPENSIKSLPAPSTFLFL